MTGDRGQRHKESIPVGMQKNAESLEGRMRTAERERERENNPASERVGVLVI